MSLNFLWRLLEDCPRKLLLRHLESLSLIISLEVPLLRKQVAVPRSDLFSLGIFTLVELPIFS
jgi:hypothetical protein